MEQSTHKTSFHSWGRLAPFVRHLVINKTLYQTHTDPHIPHTYTLTHTNTPRGGERKRERDSVLVYPAGNHPRRLTLAVIPFHLPSLSQHSSDLPTPSHPSQDQLTSRSTASANNLHRILSRTSQLNGVPNLPFQSLATALGRQPRTSRCQSSRTTRLIYQTA